MQIRSQAARPIGVRRQHLTAFALSTAAAALFALVGSSTRASAATIISDNFDNLASGANLNGRTPTVSNGKPWVSTTATLLGNGAGGLNADTLQSKSGSIDLGAGYLSSNPGIYDISADLTQPAGGAGSSWVAVGLASGNDVANNFVGNNGAPWVLYRYNGQVVIFAGPANTQTALTTTATTGVAHNFKLELDTTPPSWTLNAFLDGAQLDLNGAAAGTAFTYTTNPTASHYAGLSTGTNGAGATATVDNVVVTGPVPEPGSAVMIVAALGLTTLRRRHRPI
jgi:hypothetical protein